MEESARRCSAIRQLRFGGTCVRVAHARDALPPSDPASAVGNARVDYRRVALIAQTNV